MHAGTDGLGVRHGVMFCGLWVGWWGWIGKEGRGGGGGRVLVD